MKSILAPRVLPRATRGGGAKDAHGRRKSFIHPDCRAWRDQRLLRIGGGTTETMKYYVAKLLGF